MDRTAKSNAKTMSIKIDVKFFMWKKYFDLENVVSGQNTLVQWRKKNRRRRKVGRRGSGRRESMMKQKGVERRITLGRRREERIRRVGRRIMIKEEGGRGEEEYDKGQSMETKKKHVEKESRKNKRGRTVRKNIMKDEERGRRRKLRVAHKIILLNWKIIFLFLTENFTPDIRVTGLYFQ